MAETISEQTSKTKMGKTMFSVVSCQFDKFVRKDVDLNWICREVIG